MTDRTLRIPVEHPPERPDGRVDVDRLVASLRRRGRVHRFDSAASVPGGTGRTVLAPASGRVDRVTAGTFASLDGLLGRPEPGAVAGEPGADPVGGHVLAVPYDLHGPSGTTAFLEAVDVAVIIGDDGAWVHGAADVASGVAAELSRDHAAAAASVPSPRLRRPVAESLGPDRFRSAAVEVLERIAAGDAYVVNLTQQLTATFGWDVHALFRALRAESPAPHGAVVEIGRGVGLASVSPETFLHADGRTVTVRPIKGTRPRSDDPARDRAEAEELRTSEKERAENVMVVDLERNDLGRICEIGSVEVPELFAVEGHPKVWQLVSTVTGRLREDVGYATALDVCSPCGSVTGAPKHSAMRIIDELEPVPRGWYCGALGWVAPGAMRTAVTIRTAVLRADGTVSYGTGSGIVAGSDPAAEYLETQLKAEPFLAAVGGSWGDGGQVVADGRGGVGSDLS